MEISALHRLQKLSVYERVHQLQLLNSKASASSQQNPNMRKTCRACCGLRCESQHHPKDSLQELDRAMKKAARGEDVLIEEQAAFGCRLQSLKS